LASTPKGIQVQQVFFLFVTLGLDIQPWENQGDDLILHEEDRFRFSGEDVDISTTYNYPRVLFSGPRFRLRKSLQPHVNKGYGSLALIEIVFLAPLSKHLIQNGPHNLHH
jgi:hypothetical protein